MSQTIDHIDKYLVLLSIERQKLNSRIYQIENIERDLLSCRVAEFFMEDQEATLTQVDKIREALFDLELLE